MRFEIGVPIEPEVAEIMFSIKISKIIGKILMIIFNEKKCAKGATSSQKSVFGSSEGVPIV